MLPRVTREFRQFRRARDRRGGLRASRVQPRENIGVTDTLKRGFHFGVKFARDCDVGG